jgi:hypothetical protein
MRDCHGKPRPHRTAVEQRGVSDTDVFTNEQLATTLDELIKVYAKAQDEAFFRLGRTRHQRSSWPWADYQSYYEMPRASRDAACHARGHCAGYSGSSPGEASAL